MSPGGAGSGRALSLQAQVDMLTAEVANLKGQLAEGGQQGGGGGEAAELREQLERVTAENKQLRARVSQLEPASPRNGTRSVGSRGDTPASAGGIAAALEKQKMEFESQIKKSAMVASVETKNSQHKQKQKEEMEELAKSLVERIRKLEEDLRRVTGENEENEAVVQLQKSKLSDLEATKKRLEKSQRELERSLAEMTAARARLVQEHKQASASTLADLDLARKDLADLRKVVSKRGKEKALLAQKLKEVSQQLDIMEASSELKELDHKKFDEFKEEHARLMAESAAKLKEQSSQIARYEQRVVDLEREQRGLLHERKRGRSW